MNSDNLIEPYADKHPNLFKRIIGLKALSIIINDFLENENEFFSFCSKYDLEFGDNEGPIINLEKVDLWVPKSINEFLIQTNKSKYPDGSNDLSIVSFSGDNINDLINLKGVCEGYDSSFVFSKSAYIREMCNYFNKEFRQINKPFLSKNKSFITVLFAYAEMNLRCNVDNKDAYFNILDLYTP